MTNPYATFLVSLDIYTGPSATLNNEKLSEILGLRNNVTDTGTAESGQLYWSYESSLAGEEPLEAHLHAILDLIETYNPVRANDLIEEIYLNVGVFCIHFFSCTISWPGEIIASFVSKFPDIKLMFTFYKSEKDEEQ